MPIKYFIQKRKIVKNSVAYTKYIPVMQLEAVVGFEQIAEMVEKSNQRLLVGGAIHAKKHRDTVVE